MAEDHACSKRRSRPSEAAAEEEEDNDDLISALPDHIILHVLSFLDFRDVVKTSALSKRWSSVWAQTMAVSISFRTKDSVYYDEFDFFEKLLLRLTSPVICQLHLHLNYRSGMKERVERWIRFAVVRCVEDLRIHIRVGYDCDEQPYVLPRELLQCKSLTMLQLSSCEFPSLTNGNLGGINWHSLKALTVHNTMMVEEVINGILEGSPMLESLKLEGCYGMNSIRIFTKLMRELVISRCFYPSIDDDTCFRLEIQAPYLRSLRLLGRWKGKDIIVLKDLLSLVDVELDFNLNYYFHSSCVYDTMKGILSQLSFVDKVVIGTGIITDICYYKGNGFSLQLKCRHLTLMTCSDVFFLGRIAEVLECCPNVETLIIHFTSTRIYNKSTPTSAISFHNKFESGKRLNCRIKNIVMIHFPVCNDYNPPYWLVKLLLRDAHVLEKMIINAGCPNFSPFCLPEGARTKYVFKVKEDILRFPRASKAARVMVKNPGLN